MDSWSFTKSRSAESGPPGPPHAPHTARICQFLHHEEYILLSTCSLLALDLVSVEDFLSRACSLIPEHLLKEWDGATSSEKKVAGLDSQSLAWWGEPATASTVQLGLRSCLVVYTSHWLGVRALKTATQLQNLPPWLTVWAWARYLNYYFILQCK